MAADKEEKPAEQGAAPAAPAKSDAAPAGATETIRSVLDEAESTDMADFVRRHGMSIVVGVAVAAVAYVGVSVYRNYRSAAAESAMSTLFTANQPQQFQDVATQFAATPAAPLAQISLASAQFDAGQYDLARAAYGDFIAKFPEHALRPAAELGLATCLEATGKTAEALAAYQTFIAARSNSYLYAQAVFGKARTLQQSGKLAEAKAVYEDFMAAHPKDPFATKAQDGILHVERALRAAGGKS
jgi:predicted negative regulator of RcsB-dependent stress response